MYSLADRLKGMLKGCSCPDPALLVEGVNTKVFLQLFVITSVSGANSSPPSASRATFVSIDPLQISMT